jgi:hypothetical protein
VGRGPKPKIGLGLYIQRRLVRKEGIEEKNKSDSSSGEEEEVNSEQQSTASNH